MNIKLISMMLASCLVGSAWAGEALVQSAIEKNDYTLAFAVAKADVTDGTATDVSRMLLAQMYMQGKGTAVDTAAAKELLNPLVAKKIPEAQFMLAGLLQTEALAGMKTADGQLDLQRYSQLAKRSVAERESERYAAELVYQAAQQGFKMAIDAVCADLDNSVVGLSTSERAKWYRQCDKESWAKAVEIGQSLVPLNMRREVLRDPVVGEAYNRAAIKAQCLDENIKPVDFKVSKPVSGGQYLTLKLDKPLPYKMVSGQWQEIWIGQACGQKFSLPLLFKADGMGRATFAPDVPPEELESLIKAALPK